MNIIRFMVIVVTLSLTAEAKTAEKNSTFIATSEWQEIRPGQQLPAGLHIRINLQTGKKEAKLMEELDEHKEQKSESSALAPTLSEDESNETILPVQNTVKDKRKISKTLEEELKKLPKELPALEYKKEKLQKIKQGFASYKELKDAYEKMSKNFKTETEIITQLINEYRNLSTVDLQPKFRVKAQQRILDNFDYLLHQIDNALWFVDSGGLEHILLPIIVNNTNLDLRPQAMRVLGALTHNNPKAQIKVFERNFGSHLSQILLTSTHTEELSTALYALGSLLRKFPHAQKHILSTSGTQALIAVLSKECELKIKAKAVTIISDIILEKQLVLQEVSTKDGTDFSAATQYAELNFAEWLQANAYCEILDEIISTNLYELLEQPELTEYFTIALENTYTICATLWSQSPQMRHTLLTLKNRFFHNEAEYHREVALQLDKFIKILYRKDKSASHQEL